MMDKTILKNFAIYSRNKLIQETKLKASMLGISEEGIEKPLQAESTSDMLFFDIKSIDTHKIHGSDVRKYHRLVNELDNRTKTSEDYLTAYTSLIEEVAYTWFNRLLAIRFMEVNNYMPDRVRVLSNSQKGISEPEIMSQYNATSIEFSQAEESQLIEWQLDGSAQTMNSMFQFLFIKQCNKLNDNLPDLFETTDDYTELLLTVSYNDQEGVLYKLVNDIPEEYFDIESSDGYGQIEIIGWMYQYYNTELKDEVINVFKKNKVKKEDIPAATQLFTTDWVVKYMIDNSLGKYWLERNPNSPIRDSLEFLMPGEIEFIDEKISPEDLKVLDNAMGSGHILIYAFDVFMEIYTSEGYTQRDAAKLIVENNLYGLDIDKRSYQLAYFALMMKARQYNRRALDFELHNNLKVFEDSSNSNLEHLNYLGLSLNTIKRKAAIKQLKYLIETFKNAKEIGSILIVDEIDKDLLLEFINDNKTSGQLDMNTLHVEQSVKELKNIIDLARLLTLRYDVVATNPPYLNKFSDELKKYVDSNYKEYNRDLFSVFIYRNINLCKETGYSAYMTPNVWMFINSYQRLREYLIKEKHLDSLIQIAKGAFYSEATVDVMTFVLKNALTRDKGKYVRLEQYGGDMSEQKNKFLYIINHSENNNNFYLTNQNYFLEIPGKNIAYWGSKNTYKLFNYEKISKYFNPRIGLVTGDTKRFLRYWFEVDFKMIGVEISTNQESILSGKKWFPYQKGGAYRKWYGNNEYVVNWENDGNLMKNDNFSGKRVKSHNYNGEYAFKEQLTWTKITSGNFASRYVPSGFMFDDAAAIGYLKNHDYIYYILSLLNSKVSTVFLEFYNSTINYLPGDLNNIPLIEPGKFKEIIDKTVKNNISISVENWNSLEMSWEFTKHHLLCVENKVKFKRIEVAYQESKIRINKCFDQLKQNEEVLNSVFIDLYKLGKDLVSEVKDKDITITKIFDSKEDINDDIKGNRYIQTKEDVIKSFISYAVGCMFGRYSLDEEGLIYAGGNWDIDRYKKFIPTLDNVLIISEAEYFEDDIVNRFIEFVKVVYGKETLNENLEFVADALGGRGTPKEIIRNYFVKDFYKHHVQMYKKRPIYWLYDSGRNNGFKALVYMHRYNEDTTGVVRIDHLHKMQSAYEHRMDNLRYEITHSDNARDRNRAEKELDKLTKQLKETKDYDEKIGHLAIARIGIDLDDGVKVNHAKVQTDEKGKNLNILAKL